MNRKKSLRYTLCSLSALLLLSLCVGATTSDFAMGRNLQILFNMFRELSLIYVDPIDSEQMLKNAAEGMVKELDPYTNLIPESEMEEFEIMTTGKYGGMGAMIRKSGDYVNIALPYEGFPADKAGLVAGDLILEVDGESIEGMEVGEVSSRLKGTPGTTLHLKVRRLLSDQEQELSLKRERISISGLPYWGLVSDSIGYIAHSDFTEDCSSDMRNALISLRKAGATSIILDLRSNGGGILQEAVGILSMLLPKGTKVVEMRGRMEKSNETFTTASDPIDTECPIVVLINKNSASAAEIVAGALQDLDRAVLIGQRSFGKGLVQSTLPLGYNAFLKLTTAKYYIPSGRCIQAIDYSHREEDGSATLVADSLISEFATSNNRKVYDGGGVMPDIVRPAKYYSYFTGALYGSGHIEDYANLYYKNHRTQVDVNHFGLSEQEYQAFVEYMADKEVEIDSDTREALTELKEKATQEKYLDRIQSELDAIDEKLKENTQADLIDFEKEIRELLEKEIVSRYHYQSGAIRHSIQRDSTVLQAIELLSDTARYRQILTQQDTQRR